jgi:hypothetical protein
LAPHREPARPPHAGPETLAPEDRPVLEEMLRLGHAEDMDLLSRLLAKAP